MSNIRDLILNADDLPVQTLEVPEWGVTIAVRAMNGETRGRFAMSATTPDGERDDTAYVQSSARLVAMVACDPETNELLFTSEDIPLLAQKSAAALDRISKIAFEISGLTEEARRNADAEFPV